LRRVAGRFGIDSKPALRHIASRRAAPNGAAWLFRTRDPLLFGSRICRPARGQEGAVLNSRTIEDTRHVEAP
jgi:hypothetical protein